MSFQMTLSDLEWLFEIFNDTKHRAVSATAELLVFVVGQISWWQWRRLAWNRTTFKLTGKVTLIGVIIRAKEGCIACRHGRRLLVRPKGMILILLLLSIIMRSREQQRSRRSWWAWQSTVDGHWPWPRFEHQTVRLRWRKLGRHINCLTEL